MITMSYNGKTTKAQITDECPGCPYGGLDLSRGLFRFFAPESVGVLSGDWWFDGEGDDKPAPPPPPPPPKTTHQDSPKPTTTEEPEKPKPTPKPTPTTTEKPDPTTTSNDKKPSSSSSSSKASKASSTVTLATTSIDLSKGVASGLVQPTGTINTGDNSPDNWYQINLALVGMGAVLVAGAETGA
jgi:outer membrane biosynthesis protein TonB